MISTHNLLNALSSRPREQMDEAEQILYIGGGGANALRTPFGVLRGSNLEPLRGSKGFCWPLSVFSLSNLFSDPEMGKLKWVS